MYDEGYLNITNNDISPICISNMAKRTLDRPQMKWDVMDVMDMTYGDNSFDLIIDKSTIDAILCGEKPYVNTAKMLKECQRVLKVGGSYVAISHGLSETIFKRDNLSFDLKVIPIETKASTQKIAN